LSFLVELQLTVLNPQWAPIGTPHRRGFGGE